MKWTKKQNKHFDSILWLFDDKNRQEGRSTILAWVYIAMAMEGKKVNIIDHVYITYSSEMANRLLAEKIAEIIKEDNLPLEISSSRMGWSILQEKAEKEVK